MKKKNFKEIIGLILSITLVFGAIFVATSNELGRINDSRALGQTIVLNANNSPTISNHNATRVDEKNITWEYNNVESYASGHVTLNHQGYLGISSNTSWGITGISSVTANFVAGQNSELWLLKSVDGVTWNEDSILTSGDATTTTNNWRYIRFYNYSSDSSTIKINSISVEYGCSGVSATEDVDNTRSLNVLNASDNLTYTSCAGRELSAISFSKSGNSSSWAVIGLDRTYTIDEIKYQVVEFDYYKVNTVPNTSLSYPSIQLYQSNGTKAVGSTQSKEATKSHYKVTELGNDWYHVQMPISALAPTISGYKVGSKWEDNAVKTNLEVDSIRLSVGTCIIDNLRFGSTCGLGIFNNGTSFNVSDEKPYWFKVAWAGQFHSCTFTFDTPIAEQVAWDNTTCKSPFYIRGLATGTVVVTATLVVGYNRQTLTISNTLTIN